MRAKAQQYFSASQRIDQLVQFLPHRFHVRIYKDRIQRVHDVGLVARLDQRVEHRVVEVVVRHLASWALGTLWTLRTIVACGPCGPAGTASIKSLSPLSWLRICTASISVSQRVDQLVHRKYS